MNILRLNLLIFYLPLLTNTSLCVFIREQKFGQSLATHGVNVDKV